MFLLDFLLAVGLSASPSRSASASSHQCNSAIVFGMVAPTDRRALLSRSTSLTAHLTRKSVFVSINGPWHKPTGRPHRHTSRKLSFLFRKHHS